MDGMRGLDAYITGGRYSSSHMLVECPKCGEETFVTAETEYGATTWTPEECGTKGCDHVFDGDEQWREDEPPEPDPYDREPPYYGEED